MLPQWTIAKKRDGGVLSAEEIGEFIAGYATGAIPDYQMAALAMAVYFQGMQFDEITALTDAMMRSGDVLDTSSIARPTVDKHSTGGIGDKVSLVLAPIAACCGVAVPMISGRGLGITGGTLDKLESIPGYRTDLSVDEFLGVVDSCGCSIVGQTAQLAPADKKLYALRDVTATVPSIPLITASIMCKKLAEGTDALVLDVKWGSGAFMKTPQDARKLAETMVEVGRRMGRGMAALITDMNQPLGHTAGNTLEVIESVECLRGEGPEDLMALTYELGARMLMLTGVATDRDAAVRMQQEQVASGKAFETFIAMVRAHGGDTAARENTSRLRGADRKIEITAARDGYVQRAEAELIGRACIVLGAGRKTVTDAVDHAVGVAHLAKVGAAVARGDLLAVLHVNATEGLEEARSMVGRAFTIGDEPPAPAPVVIDAITAGRQA